MASSEAQGTPATPRSGATCTLAEIAFIIDNSCEEGCEHRWGIDPELIEAERQRRYSLNAPQSGSGRRSQ